MRDVLFVLVLALCGASWACAPTCKKGEVKSGDRCLRLANSGPNGDAEAMRAGDGLDEQEEGRDGNDHSSERSDGGGGDARDAGKQSSAADSAQMLDGTGAGSETDSGPVRVGDASVVDAECSGTDCVTDACHPNPCGHGTCSLTAVGFSCKCAPDWRGERVCNVNTNAALTGLTASAGKMFPAFKSDIYQYSVDLPLNASEVALTPTASQPEGVVLRADGELHPSGSATKAYEVAINTPSRVAFELVSDSGAVQKYEVVLRRTLALQATLRSPFSYATSFGGAVALHGGLLVTFSTLPDGTSAYLYTRSGTAWLPTTEFVRLEKTGGTSVALNDKWVIIGASGDGSVPGRAYYHGRAELSGRWDRKQLPNDAGEPTFGRAVAVSGNTVAVLSATKLHTFDLTKSPPDGHEMFEVQAEHLALEGDLIVVSQMRSGPDPESTYVFRREAGRWRAAGRLGSAANPVFGGAVSIAGGELFVADTYAVTHLGPTGAYRPTLHFFAPNARSWLQSSLTLPTLPEVPRRVSPNGFGWSMASAGGMVMVGAILEESHRFGVHRASDPFVPSSPPGNDLDGYGIAYLFLQSRSVWRADAVLGPGRESMAEQQPIQFGSAVSYDNGLMAISAPTTIANTAGAIYVFGPDCSQVPAGAGIPGC